MTEIKTYFADVDCLRDEITYQRAFERLTPARKEKATQFYFKRDRMLCVGAWLLLGHALHNYGVSLANCTIEYGTYGKPFIGGGPYFNLSHSGTRVLCAVSDACEVGCDVEQVKPFDLQVAKACMQPSEIEEMLALPDSQRAYHFYRRWTLKESFMKAHGTGLTLAPDTFAMSLPQQINTGSVRCSLDSNCTFEEFALGEAYAHAACALSTSARFNPPINVDLSTLVY